MRLSGLVETSDGALLPVGAASADPLVTGVVTTDLIEPGRYLSGGELVLTGLAWWRQRRPDRTRAFVQALVTAGVAALAAGDAQLGHIPADLVRACAEASLPLLRVPVTVPFAAIHEHVAQHLSPRRSDDVAAVLGRHRELMAAAATGRGIAGVLDLVAADLDLRVRVLSPTGRLIAGPLGPGDEDRRLAAQFVRASGLPHRVRRPGGRVYSLFATPGPRAAACCVAVAEDHTGWGADREDVVAELVSLVALDWALAGRRPETEDRLAAALTEGEAVDSAVRRAGLDPDAGSIVLVAIGSDAGAVLAEALATGPVPTWRLGGPPDASVALVAGGEPDELTRHVRAEIDFLAPALSGPLRIGVSESVRGADALVGGLAAARAVAATVATVGVAGPDRLASHALLLAAVPVQLRAAYRERVLGPLLEHDRMHRTQLVQTLAAYLDSSGSWAKCAAMMHVHVNTLRYRMERIEALTGRDLRELGDQADLLLALHLD